MRGAGPGDECADPGKGREDHVHDRTEHENQKSAVPIAELAEEQTEGTIAKAEDEPTYQTGGKEITRSAEKAKNGNRREKTENCAGSEVALPRKALEKRDMIGNHQPGGKNQGKANADVNAGADSRVAEEVKPTITGQMRTNRHQALGSQDANN
jgi:hypothetical protein